ncbi:ankyrin and het domain protein [Colletotrichum plurivorum]|uniref:Ankyrin and het domain protein n=1 Tax=Colletotrichum plurivorum TaxID=2175906 RepID=A0A8H6JMS8_9PEZI|nr:ankyrin and het domain protein [Colletotrichum plurivorum]
MTEYYALSYTWGPADPDTEETEEMIPVALNGDEFFVKPNLCDALLQLRSSYPDRWFWIDAVCINQNDLGERSSQVAAMDVIYTNASMTVALIGKPGPGFARAVDIIKKVARKTEEVLGPLAATTGGFDASAFRVDHRASAVDVFSSLAGDIIMRSGSLWLLERTGRTKSGMEGLPSWALDWSTLTTVNLACDLPDKDASRSVGRPDHGIKIRDPSSLPGFLEEVDNVATTDDAGLFPSLADVVERKELMAKTRFPRPTRDVTMPHKNPSPASQNGQKRPRAVIPNIFGVYRSLLADSIIYVLVLYAMTTVVILYLQILVGPAKAILGLGIRPSLEEALDAGLWALTARPSLVLADWVVRRRIPAHTTRLTGCTVYEVQDMP